MAESVRLARLTALVRGRVQGVSFRYHTMRQARELGLEGYVHNLPDGTVEVEAEGERARLEALLTFLRAGPRRARVERVEAQWQEYDGSFDGFQIRY